MVQIDEQLVPIEVPLSFGNLYGWVVTFSAFLVLLRNAHIVIPVATENIGIGFSVRFVCRNACFLLFPLKRRKCFKLFSISVRATHG